MSSRTKVAMSPGVYRFVPTNTGWFAGYVDSKIRMCGPYVRVGVPHRSVFVTLAPFRLTNNTFDYNSETLAGRMHHIVVAGCTAKQAMALTAVECTIEYNNFKESILPWSHTQQIHGFIALYKDKFFWISAEDLASKAVEKLS